MRLGNLDIRTAVVIAGAIGATIAAFVTALIRNRPQIQRNRLDAQESATSAWRALAEEARAELDAAKREHKAAAAEREKIVKSYYGLLGTFLEFRDHILSEVTGVSYLLDQKEYSAAQARLEALGRHASGIHVPRAPRDDPR